MPNLVLVARLFIKVLLKRTTNIKLKNNLKVSILNLLDASVDIT